MTFLPDPTGDHGGAGCGWVPGLVAFVRRASGLLPASGGRWSVGGVGFRRPVVGACGRWPVAGGGMVVASGKTYSPSGLVGRVQSLASGKAIFDRVSMWDCADGLSAFAARVRVFFIALRLYTPWGYTKNSGEGKITPFPTPKIKKPCLPTLPMLYFSQSEVVRMVILIGMILGILWIGSNFSETVAGLLLILLIVGVLALGVSMERDRHKAYRNWIEYWKKRG